MGKKHQESGRLTEKGASGDGKIIKNLMFIGLAVLISTGGFFAFRQMKIHMHSREYGGLSTLSSYIDATDAPERNLKRGRKEIISECQKLVYYIEVDSCGRKYSGSGFLYNRHGDIVTNAHVVEGASKVAVRLDDGKTEYDGFVIGRGSTLDIALIRVPELTGIEPLETDREKKVGAGDEVIALGSPLGYQNTATIGIISGVGRSFDIGPYQYRDLYQISAPISPGSSGGPLIDAETGKVLGINSAGIDIGSIGFSIPILQCFELLDEWAQNPRLAMADNDKGIFGGKLSGRQLEEKAIELVNYFYDCLNSGDYLTAYLLLGYDWQTEISYQTFKAGYAGISRINTANMHARPREDGMVDIILAASRVETPVPEGSGDGAVRYETIYLVGYENGVLKIIDTRVSRIGN